MRRVPVNGLYHVLPLHYAPFLLQTGALVSQAEAKRQGLPIAPRKSATRRDRKLRLDDYVHLSPLPETPLLRDKRERGYPHLLITFSTEVLMLSEIALLKFNPKSWRHREDFCPVSETAEKAAVWAEWERGRFPSLEVIVRTTLPLIPYAVSLTFGDSWQEEWVRGFRDSHNVVLSMETKQEEALLGCGRYDRTPYVNYTAACEAAGRILPPLDLTFD